MFIDDFISDPIDILEKRIAALELQILPPKVSEEALAQTTITDMLIQTNTLIASALSGREIVNTILNRMVELNQCLDPTFYENKLHIQAKRQFILALYPEIKKYGELVQKLKSCMLPVLDSQPLNNVPNLIPKLEQLTVSNLKMHEESQEVSASIEKTLQQYNDIICSISRTYVQLEDIVTRLETDMRKSLVTD